ncbi:helix-turn-helix transcriptional regulator [Candidatus Sodalis endolongispinus]|uniref:Helix-turn-helix transcriptional regulator n=2 Tax=Candidatus Sodalis endolongispinus TaxID=2812662 RepID=A0ABS5YD49_9GAMM|nr:helix-turn-helix transcriptional regulator [Candidatus Sodalis endolongispinus]
MNILSIDYGKKLRAIRKSEDLTQRQFAELAGLSLNTVRAYEIGQQPARSEVMVRVIQVNIFKKYTMWLIHDEIAPTAGQIAPALTHCGIDGEEAQKRTRKTVEDSDVKSSRYDQKAG